MDGLETRGRKVGREGVSEGRKRKKKGGGEGEVKGMSMFVVCLLKENQIESDRIRSDE